MSLDILILVLLVSLSVMLVAGQWMAFALGVCGMLLMYLSKGVLGVSSLSSVVWNTANSYILIAVPMFLLMGEIILRSGAKIMRNAVNRRSISPACSVRNPMKMNSGTAARSSSFIRPIVWK